MKAFKDLGIQPTHKSFTGEKIEIYNILNREIIITDYKIEPSKFPEKGNGKRLTLQINLEGKDRIVFTGSVKLMDTIQEIKKDDFPFSSTIVKENKAYMFS